MNIHLKAPFFLTQKLLPLMRERRTHPQALFWIGAVHVSGIYSAYAAMKGGIEVLTRYMAKELGSRGITVNTLAPGAIETDFGGGTIRDNAELNKNIATQTALGRVGLPDDIGKAVSMLLSDESQWITGQRVEVSGGMFL